MMKRFFCHLLFLSLAAQLVAQTVEASKAREKALQQDVIKAPLDRILVDPGFDKVEQNKPSLPLQKLKLPAGAKVSIFAVVPEARSMTLGEKGEVFVGTRGDKVYRVHDGNLDGKAELVEVLLKGLDFPNGVAYRDGDLYVAEISRILKIPKVAQATAQNLKPQVLPQKFPSDRHHGWKFIRFGPDGWLYVPVGANCNVCDLGAEYGRLYRIDVNSDRKEVVAQGIRNTVGFDWNPVTKVLWFTDNGRDLMGDDIPPDELNKITKMGQDFGFPSCHGKDIQDPKFHQKKCSQTTPPQLELPAHVAALGMRFWKAGIVIAEHGSWNRSVPQGYRVSRVPVNNGKASAEEPWIEGWLQGRSHWGRPVDVQPYFDGSLLISDDEAGVIYRVEFKAP